jgi:hypothetical protein
MTLSRISSGVLALTAAAGTPCAVEHAGDLNGRLDINRERDAALTGRKFQIVGDDVTGNGRRCATSRAGAPAYSRLWSRKCPPHPSRRTLQGRISDSPRGIPG